LVVEDQVDHDALRAGSEQELTDGPLRVVVVVRMAMPWDEFEHTKDLGVGLQGFVG
jgi:hypothetical protein